MLSAGRNSFVEIASVTSHSIEIYVLIALFLGISAALLIVINLFTRKIGELEKARADIQVEESRVFDFLHGLGEAFSEGVRSSQLHRFIVEGAIRILEARGGCLYLVDRSDSLLVPAYVSNACPPLVEVPTRILEQAATMPIALESYLRLHSVNRENSVLGSVWNSGAPKLLNAEELSAINGSESSVRAHSAIVAPLVYCRKTLGILALANGPLSTPFTQSDLDVFGTITEQSAFALYNEIIYLEAGEKKRLQHDLEIAREIQGILLPSAPPTVPGYEISGLNIPARYVSGDYYDYITVDEHRTGIVIADVSGKGVPASLIMAMCRSVIRSQAPNSRSSAEVLRRVNSQLYPDIKEDMFISMAYLILDAEQGTAMLARAGHDAPLLYHADTQEVEKLTPKGMALGIDSGEVFDRVCADFSFRLNPNDCLLLYTDGATEALEETGQEFGMPRLIQGLQANAIEGAAGVVKRLTEDLKGFAGNYPQHDDITLIAIRKL